MRSGESCLKLWAMRKEWYKMIIKYTSSEAPYKFEPYMHKINGTIANAISKYEDKSGITQALLTDYNDVITYPNIWKSNQSVEMAME